MKTLISLSGGLDSTTLLAHLLNLDHEVSCVSFTYGSKHNPFENDAAERVAAYYQVPLEKIDITSVMGAFKSDLLKTGGEIPEGHYNDASMERTVVPGRNIIFAAILAGKAWSIGAGAVAMGIHQGDHAIYPDCRAQFFQAMRQAIELGTDKRVALRAPFLPLDKGDIVRLGTKMGVPYQLTRTCYKEQAIACGKCGSCRERKEAFQLNGLVDPILYEE